MPPCARGLRPLFRAVASRHAPACALALLTSLVALAQQPPPPPEVYVARPGMEPYLEKTLLYRELRLPGGTGTGTVVFGTTRGSPEQYDTWPVLFVNSAEGWQVVDFKAGFERYDWSHIAAAPAKGYLWAFLEYTVEGPANEVPVLMSTDRGRTWRHVASVPKPDFLALFHSFSMGPNGRGTLQLVLEGAPTPGTRRLFTYVTRDWGRTWKRSGAPSVDVLDEGSAPSAPGCTWEEPPQPCRLPEYLRPTPQQ